MQYQPHILTLYNQLFSDAHNALTKEAGVFSRIGRFFAAPRRARMAERALGQAESQAGRYEQAIEDAAHRMAQQDFDIAAARAAQQKAEQQAARYSKEIQQLGSKPGRLGLYKALGAGGLGLGVLGAASAPFAYGAGREQGEAEKRRIRNIAFGAGTAAGLAAPKLIQGLGQIARGVNYTGIYPELEGIGG
jgi:hypothetical protein